MATKRGGTFCAHRGCTSKTGGGVSLFTFPKDPSRSTLWLRACNRKDLFDKSAIDLYKNYRLCEKHFEDKYMTQGKITRKRLFENAVPTIFPNVTFSIVDDEKPVKGVTRSAIPLAKEETILSTYRSLDPLDSLPEKTYEELDQKGSALEFTGKINNLSPQICRLCLEVTPAYECEAIEEIEKETLEGLLINIDFDITDNAVACNGCLKRLQDCFKFKLQITSFVNVDSKMDVNEDLSKRNPESCRVCQLCMLFIKDEGFDCTSVWDDGVILEEVFKNCLPETDLNAVRVVCKRCRSGTELYYEFMKKCREVDQRIKGFWQVAGTSKVILQDMLKLEELDRPVIVKKECLGVENNDMNIMEYPISEDVYIKNEEVDLKQEMDDGLGMSISDHSNDCDNFGNKSSKRKGDMTNNESEDMLPSGISEADEAQNDPHLNYFTSGGRHFCSKCSYSSPRSHCMKRHMLSHSDNKLHKCLMCPFMTDTWFLLKTHMSSHMTRGVTKRHGCQKCSFETNYKGNLIQHFLKHKDMSEEDMQKCPLCRFKSKYKSTVAKHFRLKHDTNIKVYKCKECSFSTKYRESLLIHQLMHKPKQVTNVKYNCDECTFSTKHKSNMVRHRLMHKKPEEIPTHRCEKCEYETRYKTNLARHLLMHEDPNALSKFKCEKCPYRARGKSDLKRHGMIHSKKHLYSCNVCSYSTGISRNLHRHMTVHQKNNGKQMYMCELCNYQAETALLIKRHMVHIHENVCPPAHDIAQLPDKAETS